jgi:hypothetical protein
MNMMQQVKGDEIETYSNLELLKMELEYLKDETL